MSSSKKNINSNLCKFVPNTIAHLNFNTMCICFATIMFYSKCPVLRIQIICNAKINMAMNERKIKVLHNSPNTQNVNKMKTMLMIFPWLASSLKLATSQYGNHFRKLCIHLKIYLIKYKNLFLITTTSTSSTSTCCHALASP